MKIVYVKAKKIQFPEAVVQNTRQLLKDKP